jgi:hypothetical protein
MNKVCGLTTIYTWRFRSRAKALPPVRFITSQSGDNRHTGWYSYYSALIQTVHAGRQLDSGSVAPFPGQRPGRRDRIGGVGGWLKRSGCLGRREGLSVVRMAYCGESWKAENKLIAIVYRYREGRNWNDDARGWKAPHQQPWHVTSEVRSIRRRLPSPNLSIRQSC